VPVIAKTVQLLYSTTEDGLATFEVSHSQGLVSHASDEKKVLSGQSKELNRSEKQGGQGRFADEPET